MDPNVKAVLDKLQAAFRKRTGGGSYKSMMRTLRIYDDDRNARLSYDEFFDILENLHLVEGVPLGSAALGGLGEPSRRYLKVASKAESRGGPQPVFGKPIMTSSRGPPDTTPSRPLSRDEAHELFEFLDEDGSGHIDIPEFMEIVALPMNESRKAIVEQAFLALDTDGSGVATVAELAPKYNFSGHPSVRSGRKTESDLLREFMTQWWDADGDGNITLKEFLKYYHKISVTIDNDEEFELMVRNAWKLSGGKGAAACTTAVQAVVWKMDGTTEIVEVKNSLGLKRWDSVELEKRLLRQGVKGMKRAEIAGIRSDQEI